MSARMPVRGGVLSSLVMRRSLASVSSFETKYPQTKTTSLPNGLTIASETIPAAQTATVGIWIDSGSRAENEYTNGTANFVEHLAFKGTSNRSQLQIEQEIETIGGQLSAYTTRESSAFFAKSFQNDVPKTVEILSDVIQNSKIEESTIESERQVILSESAETSKKYKDIVLDHLHAVAFQGQALGRPVSGPLENIESITKTELSNYIKKNYKSDRMVLVGAGAVNHEELVELAEKHFGSLEASASSVVPGTGSRHPSDVAAFVGSEVRLRDDTVPTAHVAVAVEGVSWNSPDYYTAQVAQSVIGNWSAASATAHNQGSKLSSIIDENHLALSYESFSTSYCDTGLWGIYMVSDNISNLDDMVHFTLKEWNKLSVSVTQAEIERAKAQLKTSFLLALDTPTAVANDIGRQIVSTGRRHSIQEIERSIDAITEKDVKAWAQKYLWDKDVVISAFGSIEGLLDYQRIRNDMSMMRW